MNKQKLIELRCKAWGITEDEYYCNQCSDFSLEDMARAYRRGKNKAKAETALLSQHILDLQKDKGNLTDKVRELEKQIEQNKIDLAISEHDREHNDYELTEAYKKIEQLEKENADLKCECRTCVYTDSPCVRSDYPNKDGVCSHYKNVFDENAELKKKNKVLAQNLEDTEIINKTYEKRFNDLEKENAELIQENEEMKKGLGCETCQIHLEYMTLNNKIADLEKENTELKAGRDINVFTKQLTKSKEIISEYINILKGDTKNWKKTQEKAEQFISEVEK